MRAHTCASSAHEILHPEPHPIAAPAPSIRMLARLLLCGLACASALVYPASVQVTRASDSKVLPLNSLWTADDRAVLCFLRHFG